MSGVEWPDLDIAGWAGTKRTLHAYVQMLGKLRVALSPAQPNWLFTALLPNARGVTTGPIPWHDRALEGSLDVFASELVLAQSDGRIERIALLPVRPVAQIFAAFHAALRALDVDVSLSPVPQEVPDTTPFDRDDRPCEYDPAAVERWFRALTLVSGIFDRWRAHFFGRTGLQFWWGAMDVAILLFSGKHVPAPTDRGYLLKYDLDAELFNGGLYFGDAANAPFFYAYIYPQPDGAPQLPVAPAPAAWSDQVKEWVLPYAAVRAASDPAATLRTFLDSTYALCFSAAGWDRNAFVYAAPKRKVPE